MHFSFNNLLHLDVHNNIKVQISCDFCYIRRLFLTVTISICNIINSLIAKHRTVSQKHLLHLCFDNITEYDPYVVFDKKSDFLKI